MRAVIKDRKNVQAKVMELRKAHPQMKYCIGLTEVVAQTEALLATLK
jgi:hypothetical protein